MTKSKEKTYSFDEYLETFFPNRADRGETYSDPYIFVDKLADKSRETLELALKNKLSSGTTAPHSNSSVV